MTGPVVIVGGGLAGIAAAVRLVEAGHDVVLLETRPRLGGRATSFVDPRTGEVLDNCQHVLMGCCTHLIDLYERIGVRDRIAWHRALHWTDGRGRIDRLAAWPLPAPLHLGPAFGRLRLYDRAARAAIRRGMWRLIRLGERGRVAWTGRPFIEFLREADQPEPVVRRFWNPVIVSACNLPVDRVSAATAMMVFQQGFLANRWSYTMGLATCPLADLYDPAAERIAAGGGAVRLGVAAQSLAFDGTRVTGVVTADGFVEASRCVAAVTADRLDRLVSAPMRRADARLRRLDALETSPILGVHLRFETTVMDVPHLVVVDAGVQWLFDKGVDEDGRQHVHAVISAADEWMTLDEPEIVRRVVADVHRVLPRSRGLEPVAARAVKEKRATFAAVPGVDDLRPRAAAGTVGAAGIANLLIAGDWTDTGWPATMEGAVRSGYAAAAAITGADPDVEDVPPGWLAALLGLRWAAERPGAL
ncbi:MAG: hydroxysqualene dehydroxylase HpnE [Planctomycetota bacterium]